MSLINPEQVSTLTRVAKATVDSLVLKVRLKANDHRIIVGSCVTTSFYYLEAVLRTGTGGFSPIAVSLNRTFYETVCATMYLADHPDELQDFIDFGRLMHFEIIEGFGVPGKAVNELIPDHKDLSEHFKNKRRGSKQISWHGLDIGALGRAVGIEKYTDQKLVRGMYKASSKLVHGDCLTALLLYTFDAETGAFVMKPFAQPMVFYEVLTHNGFPLFIALIASINSAFLDLDLRADLDALNRAWQPLASSLALGLPNR